MLFNTTTTAYQITRRSTHIIGLMIFTMLTTLSSTVKAQPAPIGNQTSAVRSQPMLHGDLTTAVRPFTAADLARCEAWFEALGKLERRAKTDMQLHDYQSAIITYQKLLRKQPFDQYYTDDLAYALIGMGRKAAALNALHDLFYHNGNTLYTSGFGLKPYMTYAFLEDEAGNWKEAALAYNLAGGGPRGKYFNGVWPTVSMNFTPNHPQATLLAAAANVMLGKCSWDAHLNETGNAAFSDALAYMRTATGLEPNWPVGWFYLHLVLKAAGHHHQADVAYHRALSLAGSLDNLFALGRPPVMPQPTIAVTKQ